LAVLPAELANAQQPNLEVLMAQQVDQYIERTGISKADLMLWCDPVPACEAIPLKAVDDDPGSAVVIVILGSAERRDQMEYLQTVVRSIRASGGRVLQTVGTAYICSACSVGSGESKNVRTWRAAA
jgi:hypothetical protein